MSRTSRYEVLAIGAVCCLLASCFGDLRKADPQSSDALASDAAAVTDAGTSRPVDVAPMNPQADGPAAPIDSVVQEVSVSGIDVATAPVDVNPITDLGGPECPVIKTRCAGIGQAVEVCAGANVWTMKTACPYKCVGDGECSGCAKDEDCSAPLICVSHACSMPKCGDGRKTDPEKCDDGPANVANGYGQKGKCTTECQPAPYCGDGERNGPEKCDEGTSGKTDLGACNPVCSGSYEKKLIRITVGKSSGNLGGPAGADQFCSQEFGPNWKALLVGGNRRATVTPLKGDGQSNWVISKYTHYYNADGQLLWRTDGLALLAVRDGQRMNLYADAWSGDLYPWGGYDSDWTTMPEQSGDNARGSCSGWTTIAPETWGTFPMKDLTAASIEPCAKMMPLLCVEQ
jgi:hypothetical protein